MSTKHRSDRFSDETVLATTRHAAQACLKAGVYPSKHNLRAAGARGAPDRIRWAREHLIATREIAVSEEAQQHAERRPIATRPKPIKAMQDCLPPPMAVKPYRPPPYDSPVWDEVVAGRRAWKHVVPWKRLWMRAKGASVP